MQSRHRFVYLDIFINKCHSLQSNKRRQKDSDDVAKYFVTLGIIRDTIYDRDRKIIRGKIKRILPWEDYKKNDVLQKKILKICRIYISVLSHVFFLYI